MKIYIDEELPKSCASCQFLVHCEQCEGTENYCPFVGAVGYDLSDSLIDGAPITPSRERHEECPLEPRPHGEWNGKAEERIVTSRFCTSCGARGAVSNFCMWCGTDMRKSEIKND